MTILDVQPKVYSDASPPALPIGLGVIGIGLRGQHSYEQMLRHDPRIRVVAVADDPQATVALREGQTEADYRQYALGLGAEYLSDYRGMLKREDIRAICLMCEPARASEIGCACLRAGKHVLRDKPITTTTEEALELVQAAADAQRSVTLATPLRYSTPLAETRALLQRGDVGELLTVTMGYVWTNGPLQGFTASADYVRAFGGGDVLSAGFHAIDYLNWLVDRQPLFVFAEQGSFFYSDYQQVGMEDLGQLVIQYEGDVQVTLLTGRVPRRDGQHSWLDVTGTSGDVQVRDFALGVALHAPDRTRPVLADIDPLKELARDVVDVWQGTTRDRLATAADGSRTLAVLEAARRSSMSHDFESVDIPMLAQG